MCGAGTWNKKGELSLMDTSRLAHPKPRPAKLEKADRVKARRSKDKAENVKVKARSGGQCEMADRRGVGYVFPDSRVYEGYLMRCGHQAVHIHHRIGGIGGRGRGQSALAKNKSERST